MLTKRNLGGSHASQVFPCHTLFMKTQQNPTLRLEPGTYINLFRADGIWHMFYAAENDPVTLKNLLNSLPEKEYGGGSRLDVRYFKLTEVTHADLKKEADEKLSSQVQTRSSR